jgi:adenylate kinase
MHARQELVERLETYADETPDLLRRVVDLIDQKFIPIIRHHAISGGSRINTEDPMLHDVTALRMLIDVFSERGYHATVDIHKNDVPERFNLQTGEITVFVSGLPTFSFTCLLTVFRGAPAWSLIKFATVSAC